MSRFACPRCKLILERSANVAGTQFSCPSCGQKLLVPRPAAQVETQPPPTAQRPAEVASPPPLPLVSATQGPPPFPETAPAEQPPPAPSSSRRHKWDDHDDDDSDDEFSIERRSSGRGRYTKKNAARAASAGLVYSLVSFGILALSFVLWALGASARRGAFGGGEGEPLLVVVLVLILASFVLSLVGVVSSSRGLYESNTYNRGQATAGLVCGIIGLVLASIVGLLLLCVGMVLWSIPGGRW